MLGLSIIPHRPLPPESLAAQPEGMEILFTALIKGGAWEYPYVRPDTKHTRLAETLQSGPTHDPSKCPPSHDLHTSQGYPALVLQPT